MRSKALVDKLVLLNSVALLSVYFTAFFCVLPVRPLRFAPNEFAAELHALHTDSAMNSEYQLLDLRTDFTA